MSDTFEIVPQDKQRVIDLVEAAGVDVSDWANYAGRDPATNPKYCYEWAFIEPKKVIVLNLWYEDVEQEGGFWRQRFNSRDWGIGPDGRHIRPVWATRAKKVEKAVEIAFREELPVRVIVCAGNRRKIATLDAKASQVRKRRLDPVSWAVTSYDPRAGDCELTRGVQPDAFADQFSITDSPAAGKQTITSERFNRSADVRRQVRHRANGKCEFCGTSGFLMDNDKIYIETHHIVPLFEGGSDTVSNVIALCPDHHRRAHFAKDKFDLRTTLLSLASRS